MIIVGLRGQFPRWRLSRKRLSVCSFLRCPDLWLQCSSTVAVHGLEKTHHAWCVFSKPCTKLTLHYNHISPYIFRVSLPRAYSARHKWTCRCPHPLNTFQASSYQSCTITTNPIFIGFKRANFSIRSETSYEIMIKPDTIKKAVKLKCLNNAYINVRIRKQLPDIFPIQKGLKRDASLPMVLHLALGRSEKARSNCNGMEYISFWSVQLKLAL